MRNVILAILIATIPVTGFADITFRPPHYIEEDRSAQTPADIYEPIINGRQNLAARGTANCPALEVAWEQTFNYVSDWLQNYTGTAQPHLGQITGNDSEEVMNKILNDAYNLGQGEVRQNVTASKTAFQLWFAGGCWRKY